MELSTRIEGVVIGRVAALDAAGRARVKVPGETGRGRPARSIVALEAGHVGQEVILAFEEGDPTKPVVLGLAQSPPKVQARVDGESIILDGRKEVVLKCGRASITLTRAGKVLICGAYVLSRSSGVNRIKGGSVQIN